MNFKILTDSSANIFLKEARSLLYKNEAEYSLMLGLCTSMLSSEGRIHLFRITKGGDTTAAAIQTPPHNLIVTQASEKELEVLANHIFDTGLDVPGVVGPTESASIFADKWSKMTGKNQKLGMVQKIYEAHNILLPKVKGYLRPALSEDKQLIAKWLYEFSSESLPEKDKFDLPFANEWADKAIQTKTAFLWLNGEAPVSVAHTGRPTQNGISIRAVYTPPEHRQNGYGSAVVGSLSLLMLNKGYKFCTLYTDLSNSTSNSIYQKIGYREVADSRHFIFS